MLFLMDIGAPFVEVPWSVTFGFNVNFCLGGEYEGERKMDDLKLLYRAYVTDSLSSGRMEEDKVTHSIFSPHLSLQHRK